MKMGDKVIVYGYIDGCSYETTGQTNFIISLETGERVEVPIECVIKKDQVVKKDEIKLKDIIRRINRLDENSKTYWLDTILNWFKLDFGLTKYRQGYEQGKLEGAWVGNQLKDADKIRRELNKPVVKQFVADWYEEHKDNLEFYIFDYVYRFDQQKNSDFKDWLDDFKNEALQTLVNMHQFGYEVEKEKRYLVRFKGFNHRYIILKYNQCDKTWFLGGKLEFDFFRKYHTRKELEEAGFSWVFDCEGIEIEEVKE